MFVMKRERNIPRGTMMMINDISAGLKIRYFIKSASDSDGYKNFLTFNVYYIIRCPGNIMGNM